MSTVSRLPAPDYSVHPEYVEFSSQKSVGDEIEALLFVAPHLKMASDSLLGRPLIPDYSAVVQDTAECISFVRDGVFGATIANERLDLLRMASAHIREEIARAKQAKSPQQLTFDDCIRGHTQDSAPELFASIETIIAEHEQI